MYKGLDICVFYMTARNPEVNLEDNPELKRCYEYRGYDANCSKQILVKITTYEYKQLRRS